MTSLWLTLLVKSTIVLCAGSLLARCLNRAPAAIRHLVWASTLGVLLVLPAGLLMPDGVAPVALQITAAAAPAGEARSAAPLLRWTLVIWAAGAALLLLRVGLSAWRARRLVASSVPESGAVRFAGDVRGPLSWSFGNGAVLLPPEARAWPQETRQAAILHEAAHIARRDSHALLLGEVVCAVYWFHPLVWLAMRRLREESEHAADDAVIAAGLDPADYATHLIAVARAVRPVPLLAGAGQTSTLAARIRAVLEPGRRRSVVTRRMWLASAAAVLAIAIPLAAMQQAGRKVHKIGGDVTAPVALKKLEPGYTPEAKEAKIQGSVRLSIVIEPDGHTSNIVVEQGLDPGLDANAVEAVGTWLFRPATKDGEPVAVAAKVEINFRLLD
jgi:TonB family protein